MKKGIAKIMCFTVLAIVAAALVSASNDIPYTVNQKLIFLDFDDGWNIKGIQVARDNYFYRNSKPYSEAFDEVDEMLIENPFTIEFYDSGSNLLNSIETYFNIVYADYDEQISKIAVYDSSRKIMSEKSINFCNDNGICEPCEGPDCSLMENSATCTDCNTGTGDNYCDLKEDGICDPDCNGIDLDCPGCTESSCYYEDSVDQKNICGDSGGNTCISFDDCEGTVIDSTDEGYCCLGTCIVEEFIFTGASDDQGQNEIGTEDPVTLFNRNYNKSLPVEDEAGKIYCSDVGKSTCEYLEQCLGERVYSDDEGYDCCTGDCAPLPLSEFKKRYKEVFGEDYDEGIQLPEPEAPEEFFVPEVTRTSQFWILLLLIPAIIAIIIIDIKARKHSERKHKLEYEYDYYKKYGYNKEQLRKILGDRGWKKKEINRIIK